MMAKAEVGQTVRVHYSGTLEDGTEFDSSVGDGPMELTIGEGAALPAFEQALVGMAPGDTKTVCVPAMEAHGLYFQELVRTVDRSRIPASEDLTVGTRISATLMGGVRAYLRIVDISDERVTVDLNHPLAGKDLTYEITMVEFA